MKSVVYTLALAALSAAAPLAPAKRDAAIRNSPSGSYAPSREACPPGVAIRRSAVNGPLDPREEAYVLGKTATSAGDWTSYLSTVNLEGLDAGFVKENGIPGVTMPSISFAISGGGDRALLLGGGILAAFDNRNETTVAGGFGILQLAQRVTGLSGGSWCVGSWALSGFPRWQALRDEVWNTAESFFLPEQSRPTLYADAAQSLTVKSAAGYPVSFNDVYGRALSYHFTNDTGNPTGPGSTTLWSSIQQQPAFLDQTAPFIIINAVGLDPREVNVSLHSPSYEVTPHEFILHDPRVGTVAVDIKYLGTSFQNGSVSDPSCTVGFENAGLLMGASSNVFANELQQQEAAQGIGAAEADLINGLVGPAPDERATALVIPNPFGGLNASTYPASGDQDLYLLDGGLGAPGEVIPLFPLIQPNRMVDVIIAVDSSNDANGYPLGVSPYDTYLKSTFEGYGVYPFPVVPEPPLFAQMGLNKKPVFFGSACQSNFTIKTPLMVYLPNYEIVYPTGTSTGQTMYNASEQLGFFNNAYAIATQENSAEWKVCVACTLVDEQVIRNGGSRSPQCTPCFEKYCYGYVA